jgi:hypothetical protein
LRRIKVLLGVAAIVLSLLAMMAGPAMADSWDDGCIGVTSGGECIGIGDDNWNGWNDWDHGDDWNGWTNSFDFDDCFWWGGDLFCEVD